MKSCPKCHRAYNEMENFCLQDGTPLISNEADTLSLPNETLNQEAAKIRVLLRLEMQSNINLIQDFYDKAKQRGQGFDNSPIGHAMKLDGFRYNDLPELKCKMWNDLTGQIPSALSSEEVEQVYAFYAKIEKLETLKTSNDPDRFRNMGREQEIEKLLDDILKNGSPIKE